MSEEQKDSVLAYIENCSKKSDMERTELNKEKDYIDILKHSSFNTKTVEEINEYIEKNLYSLDGIYIDKGEKNND